MTLQGKTALVTGGGTGIGWSIARELAAAGARVAIAGRRENVLRDAASRWTGDPPIEFHAVDVADRSSVRRLFGWATERIGPITILVNCAGFNVPNRTMAALRPEQWDELLAVNASGAYYCMYEALPQMRAMKDGLIINVSSIAGKRAMALGGVGYCASKFAMTALGTCVGNEDNQHGIRVTNIYPGEANTPILDHRPTPVTDAHRAAILQPDDIGTLVAAIARLPPRAHVPEVIIKPTCAAYA
ncbi:MAG: SDR family NAD(P)-dependent oxidoreductase [Planctomycetes bacterium]|nr:SDR family NAD(P)-dependent oxidoreductase [Planctomycetota bacterium]